MQGNSDISGDIALGAGVVLETAGKAVSVDGEIHTTTALQLSPGSSLADQQVQSPELINQAVAGAIAFSQTLASFQATQTFSTINSNATITGNGGVNVINFTGDGLDLAKKDVLTIAGGADDVFYVNFFNEAGFSVSGGAQIVLAGGVKPENIYWNLADGQPVNIDGSTVYGTLLNISSTGTSGGTGDFTVKNATLYGRIVGGGGAVENVTISNSTIAEVNSIQQAPEVGSMVMLALLGGVTLFSSLLRRWKETRFLWN